METAVITPYLAFDDFAGAYPFTGNNPGSGPRSRRRPAPRLVPRASAARPGLEKFPWDKRLCSRTGWSGTGRDKPVPYGSGYRWIIGQRVDGDISDD